MGRIARFARALGGFVLLATGFGLAHATNPSGVDSGLQWLSNRVQADGSVAGDQASLGTAFQARSETLSALLQYGATSQALADRIATESEDTVEYTARKILSLSAGGRDVSTSLASLLALQNPDGGFGAALGYDSNALDTAIAMLALKAANSSNAVAIQRGLTALVSLQAVDGSFGINEQPSNYISALALSTLAVFGESHSLAAPISSAKGYLISAQVSGGYQNVIDNAMATLALAAVSNDSSSFEGAQTALRTAQMPDGSWQGDVFLTALAIRALGKVASAPPPATTGQVSGRVIEDSGSIVAGAAIDVTGPMTLSVTAGADGRFTVPSLSPGTYTLKVSKAGYTAVSIGASVFAGVNTNIGDVRLLLGSASSGLQGTVRHGVTGEAIAGALVAIAGGGTATTDGSGHYRITGALPGSFSVTVSRTGFDTVTAGGTLPTGVIVAFSPSLYPSGTTPNAATLRGRVVSSATQTAVAGAQVRVGGLTTSTDGNGGFDLTGLTAGGIVIEIAASGFATRTYNATIVAGTNDVGALAIVPAGTGITVSGRISERGTNLPIPGATVQVVGAQLAAVTNVNGNYAVSGVTTAQFTLRVTAPGYLMKSVDVALSQLADASVDFVLDRAVSGGLSAVRTTTSKGAYEPYNSIEIEMEVENATNVVRILDFTATILDAQNRVVLQTAPTAFEIAPSGRTEVELETHNTNEPAGTYRVLMQGIDAEGAVQVEGATTFVINPFAAISGGIALEPPIVQVGAAQPVSVVASVFNHGNLAVPGGEVELTITLEVPDPAYNPVGQVTTSAPLIGASSNTLRLPAGGVYDSSGVLWILNVGTRSILRMAPDKTVTTFLQLDLLTPPLLDPVDMSRDAQGNLWVAGTGGALLKITPEKTVTRLATNLAGLTAVATGMAGEVWVSTNTTSVAPIHSVNTSTGSTTPVVQQGFATPSAIAGAPDGSLYVSNTAGNSVTRISSSGVVSSFATGLSSPKGIEVTAAGEVLVANGDNTIVRISSDGQSRSSYASVPSPNALRLDAQGNLFVSSFGGGTPSAIYKIPPGGGTAQTFARSLVALPQGMAYDSQGNLYIVGSQGTFRRLNADGSITDFDPTPANSPFGVAMGPGGKPFVSLSNSGNILRYDTPTTKFTYLAATSGLSNPRGMVWDGANTLYVAESTQNRISALNLTIGTASTVASSFVTSADDLYFAPNGDLFILNGARIHKIVGQTGSVFSSTGFSGLAFAASGAGGFYIQENFTVRVMNSSGGIVRSTQTPNFLVRGIAVGADGFILVGDTSTKRILRIDPANGAISATNFADLSGLVPPTTSLAAIASDANGGVFALTGAGHIIHAPAGASPSIKGTVAGVSPNRLTFDPSTNTVYVKGNSFIDAFSLATLTSRRVVDAGSSGGAIVVANALIHVGSSALNEVVSYSAAGAEVDTIAGFSSVSYVTWDGSRVIASDQFKTITIVPGQLPRTLAREAANFVTFSNGTLYGTKSQQVVRLNMATRKYEIYFNPVVPGTSDTVAPFGIAVQSNGTLSFASSGDHRVVTLDASRQVIASYAGVGQVTGLAVDPAGRVYAASSTDFRMITRIEPSGQQSTVFVPFTTSFGLAFLDGTLYATRGGSLIQVNSQGVESTTASGVFTTSLQGITATGNRLYMVDSGEAKVRRLDNGLLATFASGASGVTALRAGADGALYAANRFGSVMRMAQGEIRPLGTDLGVLTSLNLGASGRVYSGSSGGYITSFEPVTFKRLDMTYLPTLVSTSNASIGFVAPDASEVLAVSVGTPADLYRLTYAPPPPAPAPGTIVAPLQRATVAEIPVGGAGVKATFQNWTPPYGGDFKFTIRRVDGTPGEATNMIHVGPAAGGTVQASRSVVSPGSPSVRVTAQITGTDFTAISKVDGARIEKIRGNAISTQSLGADAAGNIYMGAGFLYRITPEKVMEQAFLPLSGSIFQRGTVPVDSAGRVYVVAGLQDKTLYRVPVRPGVLLNSNDPTVKAVTLPESVVSIVRDSQDVIWALAKTNNFGTIYRVEMDNAAEPYRVIPNASPIRNPFALTIDAKDNLYAFNGFLGAEFSNPRVDGVIKIEKDGRTSVAVGPDINGDPRFEFEGMAVAGDCADNLLIAPSRWKKYGQGATNALGDIEEHVLVQLIGRTGQVGKVVNGWDLHPDFQDFDTIVYDRFSRSLLIRNELFFTTGENQIYRLPLSCGSLSTDLHVVLEPGQAGSGFSPAPIATLAREDGSQELVWRLEDIDAVGRGISFDTTLPFVSFGEKRPVAREVFLILQNSFSSGEIRIPLVVPSVDVDGLADVAIDLDDTEYGAGEDAFATVLLRNRDAASRSLRLAVDVLDAQGVLVTQLVNQVFNVPANQVVEVPASFNVGTLLVGGYRMQARISDPSSGAALSADTSSFDIVAEGTTVLASLFTDKAAYDPLDLVTFAARFKNVSLNAVASGLSATLVLKDANGTEVLRETRPVAALVPDALVDVTFQYRLRAADIGQFTAQLTVSDPAVIGRNASFTVRSSIDTGTGLRGALTVQALANVGDVVPLSVRVGNGGNAPFTALPVTFRVVNPSNGNLVATLSSTIAVHQGAEVPAHAIWDTRALSSGGNFVVAASAAFEGREIPLGQATVLIGKIQPFGFAPRANAQLSEIVESEAITVAGIVVSAPIAIVDGEYRIGSGGWTAVNGMVNPGDQVAVRVAAAPTFNTATSAQLTISGASASFQVTTINPRLTPDAFTFGARSDVPLATTITSGEVTITGIDVAVPVSVTGGEYRIGLGDWTTASGLLAPGSIVQVRLTSPSVPGATGSVSLTIGGVTGVFTVTTTAVDGTPEPFQFLAQNDVPLNSVRTSNTVTISGITTLVTVQVSNGQCSVNGSAFSTTCAAIGNGGTLALRLTASSEFSRTTTATVTIGGVSADFAVTTEGEDRTPEVFGFTAQTGVPLDALRTSESRTIRGVNTPVAITVTGGEYQLNGGPFVSTPGTVSANDEVSVRVRSASTFATETVATLRVSELAVPFSVTTKDQADIAVTPDFAVDARLLVLVSCKAGGLEEAEDDTACVQQRVTFLDGYLSGLAIQHAIVTTADAFKTAFRSGAYNTYWISGGARKLMATLAEEIREAAFRGDSLVIDGVHDERNKDLDEVVGILYKGKPSQLAEVTLTGTTLPTGSFLVNGTRPIRVELTTALRHGVFNTGDPAISTNAYGLGHGLLFAFDLTGTLLAQSASALLSETLDRSLEGVLPAIPEVYGGRAFIPLVTTFSNTEAVPVTLRVTAVLPTGFSLASGAPPAVVSGVEVSWDVAIAGEGSRTLNWAVRAPQTSGTYTIPIEVRQVQGPILVLLGTHPITVEVHATDIQFPALMNALQTLTLASAQDRNARDAAVGLLQVAQARIAAGAFEEAIARMIEAVAVLGRIDDASVMEHRGAIDRVMQEIQARWWQTVSP